MILEITFPAVAAIISVVWMILIPIRAVKNRGASVKREIELALVYVCVVVVARFTFFPFDKVDGEIQPLVLDTMRMFPPRLNLIPFVMISDYNIRRELLINIIGNTAMFVPLGIIFPSVLRMDSHKKAILAGVFTSLAIELMQLPFFDRVTDIDDLILNSAGYLIGYSIYLVALWIKRKIRR